MVNVILLYRENEFSKKAQVTKYIILDQKSGKIAL